MITARLRNTSRVLRPGGLAILAVYHGAQKNKIKSNQYPNRKHGANNKGVVVKRSAKQAYRLLSRPLLSARARRARAGLKAEVGV